MPLVAVAPRSENPSIMEYIRLRHDVMEQEKQVR